MLEIQSLETVSTDMIWNTFIQAFSDYAEPVTLTHAQFMHMIERRGFDPHLSFGAFEDGCLVGFTLNGIGLWQQKRTAYDTGTGIIKSHRGRGLAEMIFVKSLPVLKENKVTQYLLEVIRKNEKALGLYQKLGFEIMRTFDYYVTPKAQVKVSAKAVYHDIFFEEDKEPDWSVFETFWDMSPSWQNSVEAVLRKKVHFNIVTLRKDGRVAGYGIIEPETGDIPQLAVDKDFRRQGLGTALLGQLIKKCPGPVIKLINADTGAQSLKGFADNCGLIPGYGQYEMLLQI